MCKCCQSAFESCYWHLIEKHFCWDESIALYEEPEVKDEKNNNMFDNWAFYDSVAIIAGRAVVTIDHQTTPKQPIVLQPTRRLKWWEDKKPRDHEEIPIVEEDSNRSSVGTTSTEEADRKDLPKETPNDSPTSEKGEQTFKPSSTDGRPLPSTKLTRSQTMAVLDDEVKLRKKLRERRMSRSQTFIFNNNMELPLIRQLSMPKFYVDTPDASQTEATIGFAPNTALMSPVISRNEFNFDLRSVVQMEKEKVQCAMEKAVPGVHGETEKSKRLAALRGKLMPLKIKRQVSVTNVPASSSYI